MKNKFLYALLLLFAIAIACFALLNPKENVPKPENSPSETTTVIQSEQTNLEKVTLERVVDGDTFIFSNNLGEKMKVRLIGVNCPESVHSDASKNTKEGVAASNFAKESLKKGHTYYLEYDKERTDKYDRILAYLWLENCKTPASFSDVEQYMFNAILLKEKHAEIMKIKPNVKYAEMFEEIAKD